MYRCPNCNELSISGFSQLSPPFDGLTQCPNCGVELRVKRKFTNYLVALYMATVIAASFVLDKHGMLSSFIGFALLVAVGVIQIRYVEYIKMRR